MATPSKVWHTAPGGTISCETDGYRLVVKRAVSSNEFQFMVLSVPLGAGQATILSSTSRRKAVQAMIAAEQAAAVMRRLGIWSRRAAVPDRTVALRARMG